LVELPGKAVGQGCRARLPGKAAGQGCMHEMAQYAEQKKNNNNKAKLRPALYVRTNKRG
jgi:hypothetical protein